MDEQMALYRRFRPQTFDDIVEQKAPVSALRQSVKSGRIGHAYLFCGQHGTGKTTIAKVFARAVNCTNPVNGNPCNECPTCRGILNGSIMDVVEIDAASNNSVDNIRQICEDVVFAPSAAKYKVYIIDEVHMLSAGAFNALLKTLEEPPKHAIFLFATTEVHKIPATILSRCQRFDFKRISQDKIVERLRMVADKDSISIEDSALRLIAAQSDGALRDALTLLDQIRSICAESGKTITDTDVENTTGTVDRRFLFMTANALFDGNFSELLSLMSDLHESGRDYTVFSLELGSYMRDLLIIRVKADPLMHLPYSKETISQMYFAAQKVSADTLAGIISYISRSVSDFKWSPDIAASFEMMMLTVCGRKSKLPPTPLIMPASVTKMKTDNQSQVTPEVQSESAAKADDAVQTGKEPVSTQPAAAGVHSEAVSAFTSDSPASSDISNITEGTESPAPVISTYVEPDEDSDAADIPDIPDIADEPAEPGEPDDSSGPVYQPQTEAYDYSNAISSAADNFPPRQTDSGYKPVFSGLFGSAGSIIEELEKEADARISAGHTNEDSGQKHAGASPEENSGTPEKSHRTQIARQLDQTGLIVGTHDYDVRSPSITPDEADTAVRWKAYLSSLPENFDKIVGSFTQTAFKMNEDSAYIVFENEQKKLMNNVSRLPICKELSVRIKTDYKLVHLYICSQDQYSELMKKNDEDLSKKGIDDFIKAAQNNGFSADIHYGDDD